MYHILLYKYKSCCDSQKFKIYCHNLLTQNDAFHQYKHSVHYWFPFYIHSSSFTVSVQTLQSPIYVPLSSSPCHTPTCQWMIDCNHTPINFCSYSFKVKISLSMARNVIFICLGGKKTRHLTSWAKSCADTRPDNYQTHNTGTLLAKRRQMGSLMYLTSNATFCSVTLKYHTEVRGRVQKFPAWPTF